MKPLEEIAEDVKEGDLVKIFLNYGLSDYIGYIWDKSVINKINKDNLVGDGRGSTLLLCGLNPMGKTKSGGEEITNYLLDNIQFVELDLSKKTLGKQEAAGYAVIERYQEESGW